MAQVPYWFKELPISARTRHPSRLLYKARKNKGIYDCKRGVVNERRAREYQRHMLIGGLKVGYHNFSTMAQVFSVNNKTVYKWYRDGVLPDPYMCRTTRSGKTSPVYLTSQVQAIRLVFNYLFENGISNIWVKHHEPFILMAHEGSEVALHNFRKKLASHYTIPSEAIVWLD